MKKLIYFLTLSYSAYLGASLNNLDKVEINAHVIIVKNLAVTYRYDGHLPVPVLGIHVTNKISRHNLHEQTRISQAIDKQHIAAIFHCIENAKRDPHNQILEDEIWKECEKNGYPPHQAQVIG